MKCSVITFPGSNCDHDAIYTSEQAGFQVNNVWHEETSLPNGTDLVLIPGGFSYGDYLRCGAMAAFAPIMREVIGFAALGGLVVGICNGFQILTEAKLLPGALLRNDCLTFKCCDVFLSVENSNTAFTGMYTNKQIIRIPISHNDGNFYAQPDVIKELEDNNQVLFRYCAANGEVTEGTNPNGSINSIAGIMNKHGNVLGMMPHPERYSDKMLGCDDGKYLFESIIKQLA